MAIAFTIDKSLRERRRINRLLDYLKREDLTTDQMERIGKRLQKSGRRALRPLVRKLWKEKSGTAIYRYTCMLDFFDDSNWLDQLVQITLKREDLEEDGRLALLDALQDYGIDVTAPPFAKMTGYGASSMEGFITDCLADGERGLVRFMDLFLDVDDDVRQKMISWLSVSACVEAVVLLEILLGFERPEVVRKAIITLGQVKNGYALSVLKKAEIQCDSEFTELIRRSIRRLSFMGIQQPAEKNPLFAEPREFYHVQAGPVDIYGSRSQLFSWQYDDKSFAALLLLVDESEGVINALSYRMKDEAEYEVVLREVTAGELLEPVDADYGLAVLRDALFHSREKGFVLPPDLYLDLRLFNPESVKPEDYVPHFSMEHLDGIVERIPGYIPTSRELLDNACLEGWLFSEPAVYDAAERLNELAKKNDGHIPDVQIEDEIERLCVEIVVPRKADLIRRLLLAADYMQHTGCEEGVVQHAIATALSLVGGYLSESAHPFTRRLILDSMDAARQALTEGYDLRLEEGYYDEE